METEKFKPNPCYEEPNPCYEEVGEAKRASSQQKAKVGEQGRTGRCKQKWIGVLLVTLFLQTLLLIAVVVAAGFFSREIITLHGKIKELQLDQAQGQLLQANDTATWLLLNKLNYFVNTINTTTTDQLNDLQSVANMLNSTTMKQLSDLQSSVNTLNTTTMEQLNSLQSSVDTLSTAQNGTDTQVTSLQSSLSTLTTQQTSTSSQVTSLQTSVNVLTTQQVSINSQVTSLQSSVNTFTTQQVSTRTQLTSVHLSVSNLTSRINSISSIDLYEDCLQETSSCTISAGLNSYWRSCSTPSLNINPSVSSVVLVPMPCVICKQVKIQ